MIESLDLKGVVFSVVLMVASISIYVKSKGELNARTVFQMLTAVAFGAVLLWGILAAFIGGLHTYVMLLAWLTLLFVSFWKLVNLSRKAGG